MLAILKREHRSILEVASRIGSMLAVADRPDQFPLGAMRWEFIRMLMQHLTFKDACVYRVLLEKSPVRKAQSVRALLEECRALYLAYHHHTALWSTDALADGWLIYRKETLALIRRLNRLVAEERRVLYPLAGLWTLGGETASPQHMLLSGAASTRSVDRAFRTSGPQIATS